MVCSDVVPRKIIGTIGGFLNVFGNLSGIISPIVIGIILERTNNFQYAIYYISAVALMGFLAYIFLVGKIEVIDIPSLRSTKTSDK